MINTAPIRADSFSRKDILLALLLFLLTFALFAPALGYEFINLDDYPYVAANPMVRNGLTWGAVEQAFTTVHEHWWLPLLWISYMLDITLFGSGPHGHHGVNVLLHAVNAGLLFWVLKRMTGSRWKSILAAALFAWHPLRVESVAWIAARKDVLSGLFFLLAIWAYVRYAERPGGRRMAWVAGCMLLGLMAKPILIVLPVLFLLLDAWPLRRLNDRQDRHLWKAWAPRIREKFPLFALSILFGGIHLYTQWGNAAGNDQQSLWMRVGLISPNYWIYLRLFFWPSGLSILHPDIHTVFWGWSLLATGGLFGATLLIWRGRKTAPYVWVGWAWFLVALFPVIRGIRMGLAGYADRYIYLPSIGLGLALVWWGTALARQYRKGPLALLVAAGILGASVWGTVRYLSVWRDSGSVFTHARAIESVHPLSLLNHGVWQMGEGKWLAAKSSFEIFLEMQPHDARGAGNLGRLLVLRGEVAEAREVLRPLMEATPVPWQVAGAWGMALLHEGRATEALPLFQEAVRGYPDAFPLWLDALRAAFEARDPDAAHYLAGLLRNRSGKDYSRYGSLFAHHVDLWRQGGYAYSWRYFERLAGEEPRNPVIRNNVAWLAATDSRTPPEIRKRAVVVAKEAVELTGARNVSMLDTLAAAQASAMDFTGALETGERARVLAAAQGDDERVSAITRRLQLYRAKQPYQE